MSRTKITLQNDFHGTTVKLMAERQPGGLFITHSQAQRARRELCGIKGCTCSGPTGQRVAGNVGYQINETVHGFFLNTDDDRI